MILPTFLNSMRDENDVLFSIYVMTQANSEKEILSAPIRSRT